VEVFNRLVSIPHQIVQARTVRFGPISPVSGRNRGNKHLPSASSPTLTAEQIGQLKARVEAGQAGKTASAVSKALGVSRETLHPIPTG